MTTKHSPLSVLTGQALKMAQTLKAAERGELGGKFAERIEAARRGETLKVGVVMDDKVITLTMPWSAIAGTSEAGLTEYILRLMQEKREVAH